MSSVRRCLGRLGYKGRAARRKPLLRPANIARRYRWAKEMIKKPLDFWKAVIFSDESSFAQFSCCCRLWMWRSLDQEFRMNRFQPTVKHGDFSVMVWGVIWHDGKSELVVCVGRIISAKYIEILKEGLLPIFDSAHVDKNHHLFMEAKTIQAWHQENGIQKLWWPSQSPDINPIEHI